MKKLIIMIQAAILMAACSADEYEYCADYQCYLVFDTQLHLATPLDNALNPLSPGIFCQVRQEPKNGIRNLRLEIYGSEAKYEKITTAEELRRDCRLGASNGIVVGFSSLSQQLYAFDLQCPNCLKDNYPYTKYALSWANNGQWLKCSHCHRSYDLNNNGYVVDGDGGLKLLRYRASYGGKVLSVHN